ncbi:type VI secretion system membrane subunit TssM [Pseudoduganella sp. RAF53_2]|uniref:type VI secretion system membrane subunit TssM n=1 Tax=unclassified Pseudoduganella TaxID=2637179 RepID=UPI003F9A73C6
MLRRIWYFLTDTRNLTIIGFAALAGFFCLGAEVLELALIWAIVATAVCLLLWLAVWWLRRVLAAHKAERLARAMEPPPPDPNQQQRDDVNAIHDEMLKAIGTIRHSKLGIASGTRALYELPWYMIIGNPAAGKSSAITQSGLQFPFADSKVVQGVGGTRNCDWFFTTEGILLDTAGRYAVEDEHRGEWVGFLELLKKHRSRAPINGILIAISVAELRGDDPEAAIKLARSLRKRVQDLIEQLEVFAPVYVLFTKADLIAGFSEFFAHTERNERDRVWGATMPYKRKAGSKEMLSFFDQSFDELCEGLKDMGVANMAQQRRDRVLPGVYTFPLEFAAARVPLRAFLATLFEENPFQFKPVFRGFYFTSALQEGAPSGAQTRRVARRFALATAMQPVPHGAQSGFFLLDLFRKVIFADKQLVSQYTSRTRMRLKYAGFAAAALLLGGALGGWSWSYSGNRELVRAVQADLDKAVRVQNGRLDLQSRLQALEILQDRMAQLEKLRKERPWLLDMGLYQGALLEAKLREEYFAGMKEVLVKPVAASLEALLYDHANGVPEDVYNALKTYLMLCEPARAEATHMTDQLTRHWRGWLESNRASMPREQMIRSAERLLNFYLSRMGDSSWPRIEQKLTLVDAAREHLRHVVRGMPARDRVYAEVKARANTRFQSMSVARIAGEQDLTVIAGSHAIPGAFTREAWEKYVEGAFKEAAGHELQSTDWVLKTSSKDDLSLEGSPEQIQKNLVEMYKSEYVKEWRAFVQGIAIADMGNFNGAVGAMNRLGDPQTSPIAKVLNTVYEQTAWDNPAELNAQMAQAQTGVIYWLRSRLFQRAPSGVNIQVNLTPGERAVGAVGREFAALGKLVAPRDKDASPIRAYLDALSRLRTRLNSLKNQGDPGPGARQFMQQTLEGSGSELADALRLVDEQMLMGMNDVQKQAIRPILVRPLIQTFSIIIGPAEAEINKTWLAQVYEPFNRSLAGKYPFTPNAHIEASQAEIAQFFGPDGLVAKFVNTAMGPLVVRRGDVIAPRTWADMGITLAPQAVQRFAGWIAPIGAGGVAASAAAQTVFQILPSPAPGTLEYTIDIDGQQLRYRNTPAQWANMVHPGPQGVPGAHITAVTFDGRNVEILNEPGQFGLRRMIEAATRTRKEGGVHELRWSAGGVSVAVDLRIISSPEASPTAQAPQEQGFRGLRLPETIVGAPPITAVATITGEHQ